MTPPRPAKRPLVLGLCGFSGSGKTTLIERLVPGLKAAGLAVAVVKHDAHSLSIDPKGKDSDRLFRAGADVLVHDDRQGILRFRAAKLSLAGAIERLGGRYDLVLVEGHKKSPGPKFWLLGENETAPPAGVTGVIDILPRNRLRPARAHRAIVALLGAAGRHLSRPTMH